MSITKLSQLVEQYIPGGAAIPITNTSTLNDLLFNEDHLKLPQIVLIYPQQKPIGHYICLLPASNDAISVNDSLGLPREAFKFINPEKFSWKFQTAFVQRQDQSTDVCGRWCLWFIQNHLKIAPPTKFNTKDLRNRIIREPNEVMLNLYDRNCSLLANDRTICQMYPIK